MCSRSSGVMGWTWMPIRPRPPGDGCGRSSGPACAAAASPASRTREARAVRVMVSPPMDAAPNPQAPARFRLSYARSARCAPGGTGLAVWLTGSAARSARCAPGGTGLAACSDDSGRSPPQEAEQREQRARARARCRSRRDQELLRVVEAVRAIRVGRAAVAVDVDPAVAVVVEPVEAGGRRARAHRVVHLEAGERRGRCGCPRAGSPVLVSAATQRAHARRGVGLAQHREGAGHVRRRHRGAGRRPRSRRPAPTTEMFVPGANRSSGGPEFDFTQTASPTCRWTRPRRSRSRCRRAPRCRW